jgi:hypothetical protein
MKMTRKLKKIVEQNIYAIEDIKYYIKSIWRGNIDIDLHKVNDIDSLFSLLNANSSFLDYSLIEEVIVKFFPHDEIKQEYQYMKDVDEFKKSTLIQDMKGAIRNVLKLQCQVNIKLHHVIIIIIQGGRVDTDHPIQQSH